MSQITIDYDNLQHHPFSERLVDGLVEKVERQNRAFFRNYTAYYLTTVASMMHAKYIMPNASAAPVNLFSFNLAPSGYGKGHTTYLFENEIMTQFINDFENGTMPHLAGQNLRALATKRSVMNHSDFDTELARLESEFAKTGPFSFAFDEGSSPAAKQYRHHLLMANCGAMNLQVDEIGNNLSNVADLIALYLELFDGSTKGKLTKNTADSSRVRDIRGIIPANMLLFGTPAKLLDGSKTEDEFLGMLEAGIARRSFYAYVDVAKALRPVLPSPMERLQRQKVANSGQIFAAAQKHLGRLADPVNAHKKILVPDETALLVYQYQNDCILRAHELRQHELLRQTELSERHSKTLRLAATYAFIDESPEVTKEHFLAAVAVAEESGEAFNQILNRDRSYVRLAKFMADCETEVTQTDLLETLPFYKGTKQFKDEMMTQAIAWGYKNNIIIKKRFTDSVEFFRGETLKRTRLDKIRLAYSNEFTENYRSEEVPFEKLHMLTQAPDMHWVNHHLKDGYRHDDNCIPGFNLVVLDVEHGVSLELAKSLLQGYKALYYTTRRHTDEEPRFRIVLPTNYELSLEADDYKEFMKNLFEWLPFDSDTQTGQRSRKWLTNPGHYEYTDGELLDVLPFIPKTAKNEERRRTFNDLQSLDNLERWVVQNTGDGNRNNQLMRYAFILLDAGKDMAEIQSHVLAMNDKLADKLSEDEILNTIMVTVGKRLQKQAA